MKLAFCLTCNARDRIISGGRCHVCGQPPGASTVCPPWMTEAEWAEARGRDRQHRQEDGR